MKPEFVENKEFIEEDIEEIDIDKSMSTAYFYSRMYLLQSSF